MLLTAFARTCRAPLRGIGTVRLMATGVSRATPTTTLTIMAAGHELPPRFNKLAPLCRVEILPDHDRR